MRGRVVILAQAVVLVYAGIPEYKSLTGAIMAWGNPVS